MNVSRCGTFVIDNEQVTGLFVSATVDELRAIPHNPLLSRVELYPLNLNCPNVDDGKCDGVEREKGE